MDELEIDEVSEDFEIKEVDFEENESDEESKKSISDIFFIELIP